MSQIAEYMSHHFTVYTNLHLEIRETVPVPAKCAECKISGAIFAFLVYIWTVSANTPPPPTRGRTQAITFSAECTLIELHLSSL